MPTMKIPSVYEERKRLFAAELSQVQASHQRHEVKAVRRKIRTPDWWFRESPGAVPCWGRRD